MRLPFITIYQFNLPLFFGGADLLQHDRDIPCHGLEKVTTKLLNIGLVACQRGHRSADALLLLKKSSNSELLKLNLAGFHLGLVFGC